MKADILVGEIGSTTTLVHAFDVSEDTLILKASGISETTNESGSVYDGMKQAIRQADSKGIDFDQLFLSSSAAGGLSMIVVGLVKDMTVKAASEAALGAGANLQQIYVGKLSEEDVKEIASSSCNILLLAGGVDYGEKEVILHNANMIASIAPKFPIIYAGNRAISKQIITILEFGECEVYGVDNVYPTIDELVVLPTRTKIQEVFERHIIHAKGIDELSARAIGRVMPTPAAVMRFATLLQQHIGNILVIDVGGATTDVHSVNPVSEKFKYLQYSVEPDAKRTVEGDLGVFKNRGHVYDTLENPAHLKTLLDEFEAMSLSEDAALLRDQLTNQAVKVALFRHVGRIKVSYGQQGKKTMIEGKDCTNIDLIILTGGALLHHANPIPMIRSILREYEGRYLLPSSDVKMFIDQDYLISSLGVLSLTYPNQVISFFKNHYQGVNYVSKNAD